MRMLAIITIGLALAATKSAGADEATDKPRPVPLTRPDMKQMLEDMKAIKPRIPLPELTEEDKAKLGERGSGYEARLRYHYMPGGDLRVGGGPGSVREPDPSMSLDYRFKTELFWIVSRANNCHYCLGHQENKLAVAGLKEDEIAALDGDWSEFTVAERAAFAFARKFTYEPHRLCDADIDALRKHYKDLQILEMILSMAGNNSINRWKDGVGVPQSSNGGGFGRKTDNSRANEEPKRKHTYLTPTSQKYKDKTTKVAPFLADEKADRLRRSPICDRPALEPRVDVEKALEGCRQRTPRLPLVEEDKARALLPKDWAKGPLPQWVRLLANFPKDGTSRIVGLRNADEKGDLEPLLKAQVSWIIARQDRAWYAVGEAKRRLKEQGWSDEQVYKLDGDWADFTPAERALFTVARNLATSPVVLTDRDVAKALKLSSPRDVVQLISYTTNRAAFDRITEAAGLQLEK